MSDIRNMFAAKASERAEYGGSEPTMVKTTIKVKDTNIRMADWIAEQLGMTRQEVMAAVLDDGLFDALSGCAFGLGYQEGEREAIYRELVEEQDK